MNEWGLPLHGFAALAAALTMAPIAARAGAAATAAPKTVQATDMGDVMAADTCIVDIMHCHYKPVPSSNQQMLKCVCKHTCNKCAMT